MKGNLFYYGRPHPRPGARGDVGADRLDGLDRLAEIAVGALFGVVGGLHPLDAAGAVLGGAGKSVFEGDETGCKREDAGKRPALLQQFLIRFSKSKSILIVHLQQLT